MPIILDEQYLLELVESTFLPPKKIEFYYLKLVLHKLTEKVMLQVWQEFLFVNCFHLLAFIKFY